MNGTILTILSLSASGSLLALILLVLRPIVKNKVSKTFQYYIWLLVLLRLVLPVTFDGSIMNQIMPSAVSTVSAQAPAAATPKDSGVGMAAQAASAPNGNEQNTPRQATASLTDSKSGAATAPGRTEPALQGVWDFALKHITFLWLLGAALYFGYFILTYLRFNRKLKKTNVQPCAKDIEVFEELRGNKRVRLACNPYIHTPLLIGFLSPCIVIPQLAYTPNGMKLGLRHILRHELTHFRRQDLLYKWFAVFVSSLHWFNPLMLLIRREIGRACELACDEAVIRSLDAALRKDYGETLLSIASSKRSPACVVTATMCEGKRELKERLESIMSYKSKSVAMVAISLVLALLLMGCSVAFGATKADFKVTKPPVVTEHLSDPAVSDGGAVKTPAATTDAAKSAPAGNPETAKSQASSGQDVFKIYNAVLQNKAEFFSTDNKKKLYLNQFLTNKELYGTAFKVTRFSVLDMDGDKEPEVVLELSVGGNPEFYEILHQTDGKVYGYMAVYRGLESLKADGTFQFSNGAADNGWGKLIFESNANKTDIYGYSKSTQDNTGLKIAYFVQNKEVTKESFDTSENKQSAKKDAVWHAFSKKNIETELSLNP